ALDLLAPDVHEHLIDRGDWAGRAGGELGWWARRLPRYQIAVRAVERRVQDGRDRHAVGDDVFEIEVEPIDAERNAADRLPHRADQRLVRPFGLEIGVAAERHRVLRVAI